MNIEHQYLQLLKDILEKGTLKPAARENMPGTKSLFGYQMRHDLSKVFPLLTTKQMSLKNIVVELLWFLKGDTNIKFLVENGCNIWNQDAYQYYCKLTSKNTNSTWNDIYMPVSVSLNLRELSLLLDPPQDLAYSMFTFEEFCTIIKNNTKEQLQKDFSCNDYILGDCGHQYGKVWRDLGGEMCYDNADGWYKAEGIDQIKNVLNSLKNNPEGRRHIVTAVDPTHDTDLALYWCHSMFQFNCRPIPWEEKLQLAMRNPNVEMENLQITEAAAGNKQFGNVPQYYLDCHLYQRSADTLLGVPYNIASYSLLTMIFAKVLNMIPGEFIHSFGDVHLYENHFEAAKEQLKRQPLELPKLEINNEFWNPENSLGNDVEAFLKNLQVSQFLDCMISGGDLTLREYKNHGKLVNDTTLSTGIKK